MFKKIILIVQREYEARAFSKAFLVLCFLLPVMLVAMLMSTRVNTKSREQNRKTNNVTTFQVIDEKHFLKSMPPPIGNIGFDSSTVDLSGAIAELKENKIEGILNIKDSLGTPHVSLFSEGPISESDIHAIRLNLQQSLSTSLSHVSDTARHSQNDLLIHKVDVSETSDENKSIKSKAVLAISLSVLVYFFIFFYGVRTLNAVVEEKMNRVSEIIISSVTPFELMAGKILGTTLAVLTQVVIVITFTFVLTKVAMAWMEPGHVSSADVTEIATTAPSIQPSIFDAFTPAEWVKITFGFTVFFIVGFMLYAAIFAAIGAAMEPNADTMQFVFPVLIPLLFSLILVVTSSLSDPDNNVVWWASFIPFTSPVVMTMRLVQGVGWGPLIISMLLLIGSFVGITFLSGRIFRVGILLYGTKPDLKTIGKWLFNNE